MKRIFISHPKNPRVHPDSAIEKLERSIKEFGWTNRRIYANMGKHTEKLELIDIDKLIPYANNARIHSDEQIKKLQASIRELGFVNPVLIDKEYGIIAGHARVEAAKREGITKVPCVWVEHLTEAQKKAYILADNKLAELADWDMDIVYGELDDLEAIDFDISLTGFEPIDIDLSMFDKDDSDTGNSNKQTLQCPKCGFEWVK